MSVDQKGRDLSYECGGGVCCEDLWEEVELCIKSTVKVYGDLLFNMFQAGINFLSMRGEDLKEKKRG